VSPGVVVGSCWRVSLEAHIGMALRHVLPEHHLTTDSKEVIKLAMGLTTTMSALVLALLVF